MLNADEISIDHVTNKVDDAISRRENFLTCVRLKIDATVTGCIEPLGSFIVTDDVV
jgi:hypothetical protein